MTIAIARGRMLRIREVRIELAPGPHPFERTNEESIAETWARETAANPNLFNGTATLLAAAWLDNQDILRGQCHLVRYATLLHWIRNPDTTMAEHLFAHAIPISADGRLIAIRMGAHTANAGKCYFAAGSIDADDILNGEIDIDGNMAREVAEETGLNLSDAVAENGYHLWRGESHAVLLRRYRFRETADVLGERIGRHVADDPTPEIEGPVILGDRLERPSGLASHMVPVLDWLDTTPPFHTV